MDAVPGKHNICQFTPLKIGIFYGMCSELCGVNHSYMPVVVEVIPINKYRKWETIIAYYLYTHGR